MLAISVLVPELQVIHSGAIHFEQFARIAPGDVNDLVEKGGKAADAVPIISGPGLHIVLDILHSDVFEETTAICERSVGTVFQLPNPDAIYSRDKGKEGRWLPSLVVCVRARSTRC
jgi:hypothetical protein